MATYIEDEETSKLIEEYAKFRNNTKTGALRDLLRQELKQLRGPVPEDRYQSALAFVLSESEGVPVTETDINSLYEYLDAD